MRVAIEPNLSCGRCDLCLSGHYTNCHSLMPPGAPPAYGFTPTDVGHGFWGGYSQYMHLHERTLMHRFDDDVPIALASLYQPLAAGISLGCADTEDEARGRRSDPRARTARSWRRRRCQACWREYDHHHRNLAKQAQARHCTGSWRRSLHRRRHRRTLLNGCTRSPAAAAWMLSSTSFPSRPSPSWTPSRSREPARRSSSLGSRARPPRTQRRSHPLQGTPPSRSLFAGK